MRNPSTLVCQCWVRSAPGSPEPHGDTRFSHMVFLGSRAQAVKYGAGSVMHHWKTIQSLHIRCVLLSPLKTGCSPRYSRSPSSFWIAFIISLIAATIIESANSCFYDWFALTQEAISGPSWNRLFPCGFTCLIFSRGRCQHCRENRWKGKQIFIIAIVVVVTIDYLKLKGFSKGG